MRILAIIALSLFIVACGSTKKQLSVEEKRIVVLPPEGLWNCPDAPQPPSGAYTQAEVADYVLKLYESHQICEASLEAVRDYLERAKLITDEVEDN